MTKSNKIHRSAIHDWPHDDRPREKLFKEGAHKLSNSELLAILLRTGVKGASALDLARQALEKFKSFRKMSQTDLSDWKDLKGLGMAKISQIKAAIEIGRRFLEDQAKECSVTIKSSEDVARILMPRMRDLKREVVKVMLLNSKNSIIDIVEVEEGTVNYANPIIREIFQKAIQSFASSIICIHNHPAGDPSPSKEDEDFTKRLFRAGTVLQVNVLDHVIIGNNRYYSFIDEEEAGVTG